MSTRRNKRRARHRRAVRECDAAWDALEEGDVQLARKEIARAIDIAADNLSVWLDAGRVYRTLGDLKDAERALKGALRIQPSSAEAHCELAIVYSAMGLTIRAVEEQRRAVELRPQVELYGELLRRFHDESPLAKKGEERADSGDSQDESDPEDEDDSQEECEPYE